MTTLINARPRFGLEGERLFCYVSSRYYAAAGMMADGTGVWDLQKVAELIRGGAPIEAAFTLDASGELQHLRIECSELRESNESLSTQLGATTEALEAAMNKINQLTPQPDTAETPQPGKVEQAAADFNAATPEPAASDKVEQAKQDFLAEPSGAFDVAAAAMKAKPEDYRPEAARDQGEPKADVEGAMEAQEAPPKGE